MSQKAGHHHDFRDHEDIDRYHKARTILPGTVLYHEYLNKRILSCLPKRKFRRALDLMCGEGIMLPSLEPFAQDSIGLDLSETMLKHATQRSDKSRLVLGDACKIPFRSSTFDLVIVRGGLHHLSGLESLHEITDLLDKEGAIIILEPCDDNPIIRILRKILYHTLPGFDPAEEEGLKTSQIVAMLNSGGCNVSHVERLGAVAFALLCNPDAIPGTWWLNYLPGITGWAKIIIKVDETIEKTWILRHFCFNILVRAEKS